MAVNSTSWQSMPLAARETTFSADDAVARIIEWSGSSASKFNSNFLWRNSDASVADRNSYRLPISDIVNGRQVLIPRAVYSAAVILSGGHGGLEGVVSEKEKLELKRVVSEIYDKLREEYQDPRTVPPWELGGNDREDVVADAGVWTVEGLIASVNTSWSLPLADTDHPWDGDAARKRVWDWSEGDWRKYRRAFLWYDPSRPEQKNSYKLPIADVIDGDLKIVPRAVNAVAAVLGGARGGVDIPDDDMASVEKVVNRLQEKFGEDQADGMTAAAVPVYPPSEAFDYPYGQVNGAQPFTVTADGRASGHLWLWNKCHAGIVDECVMAPRSATGYQYFHNGQVLTADGKMVKVGKITMGTGHAGPNVRWMPAADHYDNTGTAAAIVRVTEDPYGGYASGFLVSSLTDEQVQELRRSPISGDWRRINGSLELVAALAVNTPGFPIVASINGEPQSLVAAGMIVPEDQEVTASGEPEEKLTPVEKDLIKQVDDLDEKLNALAAKGRSRKWGKLMAALDERGK